ncbi:phosphoribosylanthranilate isomerase [Pseudomonas sp. CrR25]|nr:phosphoribosylanthranilate isomerase [Pseudomonas sp. CrR25]
MPVVRSKICGITRVEDALVAAEAGADAIGLVFYAKSPRAVTVSQARAIMAALPPFVTTVGLFVDATRSELNSILEALPLDLLQFHGNETAAVCEALQRPYVKALRVRPGDDIAALIEPYANAAGILLDTYVQGVPGGTGEAFDWSLVPHGLGKPIILAGGLTPENVRAAIDQVRPYAVDVSGGVEARKGIKDAEKVRAFVHAVRGRE